MVMVSSEDLPLDIQVKKLLDWLISRRICSKTWHDDILIVREKISSAIKDMPEHPQIKELLSGTRINHFVVLEIIEILKETEKDSKNFLGMYGSRRMKDWKDIESSYRKGNCYLAEAGQFLLQAVVYDIPAFKKRLTKYLSVTEEAEKKERELLKRSNELINEFVRAKNDLGITLSESDWNKPAIRKSIIKLLDDLPTAYDELAFSSQNIRNAREYYTNFARKTNEDPDMKILPILDFLMSKGNVTTYEWIHGESPISIEPPVIEFGVEDEEIKPIDEIDFGDEEIDFGEDNNGDIDWGNLDGTENIEEIVTEEIDWDAVDGTGQIVVEDGGVDGGVARDNDALSILDNRRTRLLVLDDLSELECFLQQRLNDLKQTENGLSLTGSDGSFGDPEFIESSITLVNSLISSLTSRKMHHLQSIRSSPKYVNRIAEDLYGKIKLSDLLKEKSRECVVKRDKAVEESREVKTRIDMIMDKTKILEKCVATDISKRYNDRKVNIMGGTSSL